MSPDRRLSIDADLALSIDGVEARLVGEGGDLTLRTDQPARLSTALRRSGALSHPRLPGSAPLAALGGVTLTVEGPRGPVVTVAADEAPRRRLAPPGTRVRVHRPQDLVPRSVTWAGVAAAAAVLLAIIWHRRM